MNENLLSGIKDIVVTLAAASGAIAALRGINAWQRQLTGKEQYNVAHNLLRATYRVRNAISQVRHFFMGAGEISSALRDEEAVKSIGLTSEDIKDPFIGTAAAYHVRWRSVVEASTELDVASIEAEVQWGQQSKIFVTALRKCVTELNWALGQYLRSEYAESVGRRRKLSDNLSEKVSNIVFWMGGESEEDAFSAKVDKAVKDLEDYLRPKLKL